MESVKQSKAMLYSFTHDREGVESELVVESLAKWTTTLALHVIGGGGLNLHMTWPLKSIQDKVNAHNQGQTKTARSDSIHRMTFQEATKLTVNHFGIMLAIPRAILRNSPFKFLRDVDIARDEFAQHVREMIAYERLNLKSISQNEKQGVIQNLLLYSSNEDTHLSEQEMIADLWTIAIAGHETVRLFPYAPFFANKTSRLQPS